MQANITSERLKYPNPPQQMGGSITNVINERNNDKKRRNN